jgi:hypothetical protein
MKKKMLRNLHLIPSKGLPVSPPFLILKFNSQNYEGKIHADKGTRVKGKGVRGVVGDCSIKLHSK